MTIHRFYTESPLPQSGIVTLSGTETAHAVKVLRLRPGDPLMLMDGRGKVADATLLPPPENRRIHDAQCKINSVKVYDPATRPIHLFVSPPKSKNMDIVLKSATELGVAAITPIFCQYSVAKTECSSKETWETQLVMAIKQSANPWLPVLNAPVAFSKALENYSGIGFFGAVPRENDTAATSPWSRPDGEVSLWIGPEGGFTEEEETALRAKGLMPFTVGKWILRVETAVTALLACLNIKA